MSETTQAARKGGNTRPKWHLKHLADAMQELNARFDGAVIIPQYTLESENRMIYGWLCPTLEGSFTMMEIHITNMNGQVNFVIYELKTQLKR